MSEQSDHTDIAVLKQQFADLGRLEVEREKKADERHTEMMSKIDRAFTCIESVQARAEAASAMAESARVLAENLREKNEAVRQIAEAAREHAIKVDGKQKWMLGVAAGLGFAITKAWEYFAGSKHP